MFFLKISFKNFLHNFNKDNLCLVFPFVTFANSVVTCQGAEATRGTRRPVPPPPKKIQFLNLSKVSKHYFQKNSTLIKNALFEQQN